VKFKSPESDQQKVAIMFGHGSGWGMEGSGFMGLGFLFWLAILAAIIAAVVWGLRSQKRCRAGLLERRSDSLEILEERYARGEIDRDEYLQKKRDLSD
jgi:putative membrane protein